MKRYNNAILDGVLEEFEGLAAIPRPSGHEKAVSDYLKQRLETLGFSVVQDDVYNIIADKPATKGYEKSPRTILQGHMDMVCVAQPGYAYTPEQDPIRLVYGEQYLEAKGTSLGADDGIGVAAAIYLMQTVKEHGPLRFIVTVDEERGMTGTMALSEKYFADANFLINCDSENYDELTIGSAGGVDIEFTRELSRTAPAQKNCYRITVNGLRGGHSGERIGDGRGNAIRTLALALFSIQDHGTLELISIRGGTARNAIPSASEAVIRTNLSEEDLRAIIDEQKMRFLHSYGNVDPNVRMEVQTINVDQNPIKAGDTMRLLRLLVMLHTGVFSMSSVASGVETSANLGRVDMNGERVAVQFYPRSEIDEKTEEFCLFAKQLAALTGFSANIGVPSPAWKANPNSRLAHLMAGIFKKQNGKSMKIETIHAGLECSWHARKNPELDMVSVGVTTENIHSPQERLVLATIEPQVKMIAEAIKKIAQMV